ncbi:uncharacterized protein fam83e isoform X2 [Melanotaenia boesemani]|uniref:uncharacterized protein fam83e isoform X2 n=1 Tax=Melanotaenia boesemani TaxID=1250792 RepID=UPI001C042A3D|nr:uncharacterized protein fam83e isoform X2 [Melanotaenia boesemani]
MSNSQQQSLDENVVFLPVDESSPEFIYCEKEREAVERLLNTGPEAFYSCIGPEQSSCFLSPEEVSQISSWAQQYHFNPPPVEEENGVENSSKSEDFCSTYLPGHSDVPAPGLELGWPEKPHWLLKASIAVHASPPTEGEPQVREIIRRHLQEARQVIAIVTDRLTDHVVIGDLHNAASRHVPVYIILNQRSIQENFTLNRLRHPNIRVRVLGGKTFCSRSGKMMVGEMKDNFILVDSETVIHGSYSLTWTDAHLHRQLITVLRGPVIEMFDREFRILFAASIPAPETWRVPVVTHANIPHQLQDFSHLKLQKQVFVDPEITSPPSPPTNILLDWESMGVVQRDCHLPGSPLDQHKETVAEEMPHYNNNTDRDIMGRFTYKEHHFGDKRRKWENTSPVTAGVVDQSTTYHNTELFSINQERMKRTRTRLQDKTPDLTHTTTKTLLSRREPVLEESAKEKNSFNVDITPSSRRPVILRVPQNESFSSLSDIMKRIRQGTPSLFRKESSSTMSDRTQSMMDLSGRSMSMNHNERGVPVPRFQASLEPDHMTPNLALLKKRNEDIKSSLYKTLMPRDRPRSSSYAFNTDWRRSLAEREGKLE